MLKLLLPQECETKEIRQSSSESNLSMQQVQYIMLTNLTFMKRETEMQRAHKLAANKSTKGKRRVHTHINQGKVMTPIFPDF